MKVPGPGQGLELTLCEEKVSGELPRGGTQALRGQTGHVFRRSFIT